MRLSPACGMISAFDTAGSLAAGAAGAASWAKPPGEAHNAAYSTAPINRRRLTVNEPSDLGIEHSPVAGGPSASLQTDRHPPGEVQVPRPDTAHPSQFLRHKILWRNQL